MMIQTLLCELVSLILLLFICITKEMNHNGHSEIFNCVEIFFLFNCFMVLFLSICRVGYQTTSHMPVPCIINRLGYRSASRDKIMVMMTNS